MAKEALNALEKIPVRILQRHKGCFSNYCAVASVPALERQHEREGFNSHMQ